MVTSNIFLDKELEIFVKNSVLSNVFYLKFNLHNKIINNDNLLN